MEGWEVEEAVADHYNREWEKMNDPETTMELRIEQALTAKEQEDSEKLAIAAECMAFAFDKIERGLDELAVGMDALEGLPMYDRVASLFHDMEGLKDELKELKEQIERGETE